ncbi:hypothetical protein L3Q82_000449 [Scortum barcoo]|uniref:Uncharacterized protein n=1 Tax=Scortum barcoo TaxID=214431 RepID=A0ACB8WF14_9TELE|nr:hypothetical protein L3Q82_000449 [Scortum barcoo]
MSSHQEEARGRPRTRWRDYVSQLAWERLGVPRKSWRKCLGISAQTAASMRDPVLPDKQKKMDGWIGRRFTGDELRSSCHWPSHDLHKLGVIGRRLQVKSVKRQQLQFET